ncbi:urea transporter [Bacillus haynesii]|uniref:urea transporter n=1 Tax=Bacillus haynesii TaxID=1925021 RepID=UPI002DF731D7
MRLKPFGQSEFAINQAASAVFKSEHNRFAFLSGIISACLTVPITAGLSTYLLPYGLPVLTMPFVLCSWLFLGARKVLSTYSIAY